MTKTPTSIRLAKKGELAQLLKQTSFPDLGLGTRCDGVDTGLFFSNSKRDIAMAKAICQTCPVIEQCATWAIRHEDYGVFGGLSATERFVIRGSRPAIGTSDLESIRSELRFLWKASAKEIALRFGVDTRTVIRWRNILRPLKEVV